MASHQYWMGGVEYLDQKLTAVVTDSAFVICKKSVEGIEKRVHTNMICKVQEESGWVVITEKQGETRVKPKQGEAVKALESLKAACKISTLDEKELEKIEKLQFSNLPVTIQPFVSPLYKHGDPELIWAGWVDRKTRNCAEVYQKQMLIVTLRGFYVVHTDRTVSRSLPFEAVAGVTASELKKEVLLRSPAGFDLLLRETSMQLLPLISKIFDVVHKSSLLAGRLEEPVGYNPWPHLPIRVEENDACSVGNNNSVSTSSPVVKNISLNSNITTPPMQQAVRNVPVFLKPVFDKARHLRNIPVLWGGSVLIKTQGCVERRLLYVTPTEVKICPVGDPGSPLRSYGRDRIKTAVADGKWCDIVHNGTGPSVVCQPLEPPSAVRVQSLANVIEDMVQGTKPKSPETEASLESSEITAITVTLLNGSCLSSSSKAKGNGNELSVPKVVMDPVSGLPLLPPTALGRLTFFYPTISNEDYPEILWFDSILKNGSKKRLALLTPGCLYTATQSSLTRCIPIGSISSVTQADATFVFTVPSQYDLLVKILSPESAKCFMLVLCAVFKSMTGVVLPYTCTRSVKLGAFNLTKPKDWNPPSPVKIKMRSNV
eukprot:TRINITY_DN552_c3_g1_i1.p1 TRINITY_DN552_c3_g1~~TRINITY_DN552_c3_g1_i1.p1  ORF type:complete len:601 (+),score=41.00 TRINITY_DN552_c3_g1_i1:90-1892(+)